MPHTSSCWITCFPRFWIIWIFVPFFDGIFVFSLSPVYFCVSLCATLCNFRKYSASYSMVLSSLAYVYSHCTHAFIYKAVWRQSFDKVIAYTVISVNMKKKRICESKITNQNSRTQLQLQKLRKRIKVSIREQCMCVCNSWLTNMLKRSRICVFCYQKTVCRLFSLLDTKILKQTND